MRLPPLLEQHPRWLQLLLVIVLPAVYGAITGYFLGVSEGAYLVLSILGVVGGIGAGFDHVGGAAGGKARRDRRLGLRRRDPDRARDPRGGGEGRTSRPAILLVVLTTGLAIGFAAFGGWLRGRATARTDATP